MRTVPYLYWYFELWYVALLFGGRMLNENPPYPVPGKDPGPENMDPARVYLRCPAHSQTTGTAALTWGLFQDPIRAKPKKQGLNKIESYWYLWQKQ
jgi:hypothetical protein